MSDLISRLSELRSQYNCFEESERGAYHTLSEAIEALQEQKTGKWREYNYPGQEHVYCSSCKEEYYVDDLLLGRNEYPNYCPNCGAYMRGEEE